MLHAAGDTDSACLKWLEIPGHDHATVLLCINRTKGSHKLTLLVPLSDMYVWASVTHLHANALDVANSLEPRGVSLYLVADRILSAR